MNFLIQLLLKTCLETVYLTGIIIFVGLLLGVLRNSSLKNFQMSFGSKAIMITGFIGVPIHELSHAVFALVFGHKIVDMKLLQSPDANGVMGYVRHSYNKNNIYQQVGNFFIGTAPIFGGAISIIALMKFMIPKAYNDFVYVLIANLHISIINKSMFQTILNSYIGLIKVIFSFNNFCNPHFYIFLFLAICISSHISLSFADIEQSYEGLGSIFLVLLALNMFGLSKYVSGFNIIKYNLLITSVLILAIVLSLITFLISSVLKLIR